MANLSLYRKSHFVNSHPVLLLLSVHHLQLAVVLSNGDNLSLCRRESGDSGGSDAPAGAGRRVSLSTVASRGIGRDSRGTDSGGGVIDIVLGLGGNAGVNSDGDGGGSLHPVSSSISNRYTPFTINYTYSSFEAVSE